jgi:hypothetical protein
MKITLHDLSTMAGKVESDRVLSEQRRQEEAQKQRQAEFELWLSTLESRLVETAKQGKHELIAFSGSIYNAIEGHSRYKELTGRHGNLFCAWRDGGPHLQGRIASAIGGVAKMAYDYLKQHGMNPQYNVSYNDTDELIQIIVKW